MISHPQKVYFVNEIKFIPLPEKRNPDIKINNFIKWK
jgi:hypothetical protein